MRPPGPRLTFGLLTMGYLTALQLLSGPWRTAVLIAVGLPLGWLADHLDAKEYRR